MTALPFHTFQLYEIPLTSYLTFYQALTLISFSLVHFLSSLSYEITSSANVYFSMFGLFFQHWNDPVNLSWSTFYTTFAKETIDTIFALIIDEYKWDYQCLYQDEIKMIICLQASRAVPFTSSWAALEPTNPFPGVLTRSVRATAGLLSGKDAVALSAARTEHW